MINTIKVSN